MSETQRQQIEREVTRQMRHETVGWIDKLTTAHHEQAKRIARLEGEIAMLESMYDFEFAR